MTKAEINALIIRLVVTAIQGFLAAWSAAGFKTDKVVLGAAVAAGASLVYNLVIKPLLEKSPKINGA